MQDKFFVWLDCLQLFLFILAIAYAIYVKIEGPVLLMLIGIAYILMRLLMKEDLK